MIAKLKFLIAFVLLVLVLPDASAQNSSNTKKFVVVLDAGHGGKDPGAHGSKKYKGKEKDVALKIVLALGKKLEKLPNIKVIYTRKTDVFLTLKKRAAIANKAKADLFVSVHCNSASYKAHGTETWVLGLHKSKANFNIAKKENSVIFLEEDYKLDYQGFDPNSPESVIGLTLMQDEFLDQSIQLGSFVEKNFKKAKLYSRGVKQAGFWVLHNTYMPSILVESGFLSNSTDDKMLHSTSGRDKIAQGIFKGVKAYKGLLSENVGADLSYEQGVETAYMDDSKSTFETYKIQLASGKNKVALKPYNFKGLKNVTIEEVPNGYIYYYGETADYEKIKNSLKQVKKLGFKSAFVVKRKEKIAHNKFVQKPKEELVFKVQITSGRNKIDPKPAFFNGLKEMERVAVDNGYKYYYGKLASYAEAQKHLKVAKSKGFKTAFIVAVKNGERVPLSSVLKNSVKK